MITLVTGASRSGKSEWAETLAINTGKPVIYVATAQRDPEDGEWLARIQQHCDRRLDSWQTLEVPIDLAAVLRDALPNSCLLVDALGTWVANLLEQSDQDWQLTMAAVLDGLQVTSADVILVGEEVGWGVVPSYPMGRLFRDRLGNLIRRVGGIADGVYLVAGGHILNLSALGTPLDQ